jgi:hypothetical protein
MPRPLPTLRIRRLLGVAAAVAWGVGLAAVCTVAGGNNPDATGPSSRQGAPTPSYVHAQVAEPSAQHAPMPALLDRDIDWQANAVMRTLGDVTRTLKHTEYSHSQRVNVQQGIYIFDCSLLAQWVLKRAAPVAERTVSRGLGWRPLAADFQRRIARVGSDEERGGWRRVARVEDAAPGDVIAWIKPKIIDSKNTGHVAFIVLPPARVAGYSDAFLLRVADATSLLHADDTRGDGSGFGFGTILLVVDPDTGAPRAYGWVGLAWRAFETPIAIGRPLR